MSEWTDLDAAADGYDDAMKELAGLRQRIAKLEAERDKWRDAWYTDEASQECVKAKQDAERLDAVDKHYFKAHFEDRAAFWRLYFEHGGLREAIDAAMREGSDGN